MKNRGEALTIKLAEDRRISSDCELHELALGWYAGLKGA